MNIAAFDAFVKVMETDLISITVEQLFIPQSTVTKRIHSLEAYSSAKLFESASLGM